VYYSVEEIVKANEAVGQVWFRKDTMDFWGTRVYGQIFPTDDGAYFVTSDKSADGNRRLWSVRFCNRDGRVSTISFQTHGSATAALNEARSLASR